MTPVTALLVATPSVSLSISHQEVCNNQLPLALNMFIEVVLSVQPCCNYFVMGTLWDFAICASVMCNPCYCFCSTLPESSKVIFCCLSSTRISPFCFLQLYMMWLACKKWEEGHAQIWKLADHKIKTWCSISINPSEFISYLMLLLCSPKQFAYLRTLW